MLDSQPTVKMRNEQKETQNDHKNIAEKCSHTFYSLFFGVMTFSLGVFFPCSLGRGSYMCLSRATCLIIGAKHQQLSAII